MMRNYAIEIGIKKRMHTHIWRSTGISLADSNNVSLGQIMHRSGHTNIQSVKPYLNPKDDEVNTNISNALSFDRPESKPDMQRPKPKQPEPQVSDLKEQLTQRFIKGEITESGYLTALKNLEKDESKGYKVGYQ